MAILRFLGSQPGRAARLAAGAALMAAGLGLGGRWRALAALGLVPALAGAVDVCLLGPLFRLPFSGRRFRAEAG